MEIQEIQTKAQDRRLWRSMVEQRDKHVETWEKQQCKQQEDRMIQQIARVTTRNIRNELTCQECGKECKSKGGMTIHYKRMHNNQQEETREQQHKCKKCQQSFSQHANLLNHDKMCTGVYVRIAEKI